MAGSELIIEHPNRATPGAQATRALVVGLLVLSVVVMALVTVGGWARLQGMKPVQIALVLIYVGLAVQIARWRSGLLPVAASIAVIVLIVCAISGPQWFSRDGAGFSDPLLDANLVGGLTIMLVPLQILLVLAAARGLSQRWSVEVARRPDTPAARVGHAS